MMSSPTSDKSPDDQKPASPENNLISLYTKIDSGDSYLMQSPPQMGSKEASPAKQGFMRFTNGLKFLRNITERSPKPASQPEVSIKELPYILPSEIESSSSSILNVVPDLSKEEKERKEKEDNMPASEELQLVVQNKLENLKKVLSDIENFEDGLSQRIKESVLSKEQVILQTLDKRFEEYFALLEQKKNELKEKVVVHFKEVVERVENKEYSKETSYEAKTKAIQWRNIVKEKMETWKEEQIVRCANNIIEEDETAMCSEIKLWKSRVENMLALGSFDILIDRSLLAFNEEFNVDISRVCEFRILSDDFESIIRQSPAKEKKEQQLETLSDSDLQEKSDKICRLLKTFQLKVDSIDKEFADKLKIRPNALLSLPSSVSKKKQPMFESFDDVEQLSFHCEDFKERHLASLYEALEFLTSLRELHLGLIPCDNIRDASIEAFGNGLSNMRSLQSLSFEYLSASSKISDDGFVKFIKQIASSTSIQYLNLSFDQSTKFDSKRWGLIWKDLATLPHLTHLSLTAPMSLEEDEHLPIITNSIKQMIRLEGFELTINGNERCSYKGFWSLNEALGRLIHLRILKLSFTEQCGNLNDQTFPLLTNTLSKLVMLKSLFLEFPKCYASNERFAEFSQALSKLSHLKYLNLNFSWSFIGDECLEELAKGLPFLLHLTECRLDFTACRLNNVGHKELVNSISELFNLNHLVLDFSWCKDLSEEALNDLGQALSKLSNLENVEVSYKEVKRIVESCVWKLCTQISKMCNLKNLHLDFENCGRDFTEDSQTKIEELLASGRRLLKSEILIPRTIDLHAVHPLG